MRAGAVAHALDAELGEFGNRRDAGASQDINRGLAMIGFPTNGILMIRILINGAQMVDDGLDVVRVAQAGDKDAVGSGLEIGFATLKSVAHGLGGRDAGLPISVSTGVDDEMD